MEFRSASLETFKGRGLSGLMNLGNTCFMNAVLQCMSNSQYLTLYMLSNRFYEDRNRRKKEIRILGSYYMLIRRLWENNDTVDPSDFKMIFGQFKDCYLGFNQHDANEFYMRLMELLHESCSFRVKIRTTGEIKNEIDALQAASIKEFDSHFKNSYSFLVDSFSGQYFSITFCRKCRYTTKRFDPFFNITLELPAKGGDSLHDCFKYHCRTELLKDDEKISCDGECKSKQEALKRVTVWKTPVCLVICLKRFTFGRRGPEKIDRLIDFPLEGLDLYEYIQAGNDAHRSVYDLYGVVNHVGGTAGGHYFSYCKNRDGKWYNFNDSSVHEMNPESLVTPMAYMLYYIKRNVKPKMLAAVDK